MFLARLLSELQQLHVHCTYLLLIMGHSKIIDGQGVIYFEGENKSLTNAALLKTMDSYRKANSVRGSAFSTVSTQCSSDIGVNNLQ